jgi:hypothetical protein
MRFLNPSDKTAAMDYSSALASAVAWLGNRYLLARPAQRLTQIEHYSANPTVAPSVPRRSRSNLFGDGSQPKIGFI